MFYIQKTIFINKLLIKFPQKEQKKMKIALIKKHGCAEILAKAQAHVARILPSGYTKNPGVKLLRDSLHQLIYSKQSDQLTAKQSSLPKNSSTFF